MSKNQIKINGIRQNCYALDTHADISRVVRPKQTSFMSLEKKVLPNGYLEALEEKDYPINSATVTSYADGADYRRDPMQAIANAPKRTNLGDIRGVQEFIADDPQRAVLQYKNIISQVSNYLKQAEKAVTQEQAEKAVTQEQAATTQEVKNQ